MRHFLMNRSPAAIRSARMRICVVTTTLFLAATTIPKSGITQDTKKLPAIASSSDLSSAFPPSEWVRVERSVDLGLEYLASQQAADGRFPSNPVGQPAVTSLAVMAFLSRGHVPNHGKYGKRITRAIDFVISTQRRRGYFSLQRVAPTTGHLKPQQTVHYNHAIAGLMLGEVYGMTGGKQSRKIEAAIKRALVYSRNVQTQKKANSDDIGGWRYGYPQGPKAMSDLSVSGWALMFYRSARNAEFSVPKQYFDEGLDFVERCFVTDLKLRDEGVFAYRPNSAPGDMKPSMANTGSAMLVLLLGGRHESEMVKVGADWFNSRKYPRAWEVGNFYIATYYSSQAIAQVGGETWNKVYPQIATILMREQSDNGSWSRSTGNERPFGPTYSSSMAILALTPPYQLLPIYQR